MAPEKVTEMVLNVDLKCPGCCKKVKKVIRKIPQIRDQVFEFEKNKVKIMVVCCSPEKIRDKLCYKGGGAIQSIEIIEKSDKPKESEKAKLAVDKPKEPEKAKPAADKLKESEKAKPVAAKPKEPEKAKPASDKPKDSGKPKEPEKAKPAEKPKEGDKPKPADKPKDSGKPPETEKAKPKEVEKPKEGGPPKEAPKKPDAGPNPDVAKMVYEPVHGYPQMYPASAYPIVGYGQYFNQGYDGAPFEHGYGMPVVAQPLLPSYVGFGYEHGYNGYNNGNISHYASNDHGGEEDGEGCSIM